MRIFDPQRDFILKIDGSRIALEKVLKQNFENTNWEHPVGFVRRALSYLKRIYSPYDLELYAVVRSVTNFQMFLLRHGFG